MSRPRTPVEHPSDDPLALAIRAAIRHGDIKALQAHLAENPGFATALITSRDPGGTPEARTLLHVATDWPGHYPRVGETIHLLVSAGADVSAPFQPGPGAKAGHHSPHGETPLHWAASSGDVEALDALLSAGADIEAPGSVLGGGAPLANAVGFRQWRAAERLVERGAAVTLQQAAGMGLTDQVEAMLSGEGNAVDEAEDVSRAFWYACHGGRSQAARLLAQHGADINWRPPWDAHMRPVDAARKAGDADLVRWLREEGAVTGRAEVDA